MYKLIQALAISVLLVSQVANPLRVVDATALAQASAQVQGPAQVTYKLQLDTAQPQAIAVIAQKPDFDTEVMAPLQAAQAEAAQKAQAEAAAQAAAQARYSAVLVDSTSNRHIGVASGDVWEQLRICEAGGDYTRNSGNGYYGAYQFDIGTWANYGGFARPDLADPATQDAKARETQAARGWSPWPACARKLGLL